MTIHDDPVRATGAATRTRLGRLGVVLGYHGWDDSQVAAAPELEELGYSTFWLCGNPMDLGRIPAVARATRAATVSAAVIPADLFDADTVGRLHDTMQAGHPGRFVAGLGGAHGPRPLRTLHAYLDRLDDRPNPVPVQSRLLSALGPKMLDLAARRTAGAVPVLVTPEYTAAARERMGPDATLVVEQFVALDTDLARARDAARGPVGFQRDIEGGYARHFARMGFDDGEIAGLADRLIDGVVACGDVDAVAARVDEQYAAGADHVALMVVPPDRRTSTLPGWRLLADALVLR